MKREITIEEVRDFIANGARQFAEAGVFLRKVTFDSYKDGKPEVFIDYDVRETATKRFKKSN